MSELKHLKKTKQKKPNKSPVALRDEPKPNN